MELSELVSDCKVRDCEVHIELFCGYTVDVPAELEDVHVHAHSEAKEP